jgi:hypothetical protein
MESISVRRRLMESGAGATARNMAFCRKVGGIRAGNAADARAVAGERD